MIFIVRFYHFLTVALDLSLLSLFIARPTYSLFCFPVHAWESFSVSIYLFLARIPASSFSRFLQCMPPPPFFFFFVGHWVIAIDLCVFFATEITIYHFKSNFFFFLFLSFF
ncbi:hypothetical protein DFH27DRAFT_178452 [Peziza echinospora]|nr:hypothetical protein DFH27DRAFT_178452 [Peziza echinospora]